MLLSPPSSSYKELVTLSQLQQNIDTAVTRCTTKDGLTEALKQFKPPKAALTELLGVTKGYMKEVSAAVHAAL
eukprot:546531-Amphidinium_carterae.1